MSTGLCFRHTGDEDILEWDGVIKADEFRSAIPSGFIAMWHGSIASIPSGWQLCDGTNGTPDLRNRFIICADTDIDGTATTSLPLGGSTQTGGESTYSMESGGPSTTAMTSTIAGTALAKGNHTHITNYEIIPPFFALAFIMKT